MDHPPSDDPQFLAQLISLAGNRKATWLPQDLGAMWRHQLRAPLELDLAETVPDARDTVVRLSSSGQPPLRTFGDLLRHPSPPLDLLRFAKDFAKIKRSDADAGFPREIATALYYAVIAAALLRLGRRLTELEPDALRDGLNWTVRLAWLDDESRSMLEEILRETPTA
jgi:hypothetical protein